MATRTTRILSWTLRLLVAAVFALSAVAKLMGIDRFELYIFSFGFFSLNICYLLARLCIAMELVLALFTLMGWYPRMMRVATVGILVLFSLFLCYSALAGRNESCQCFGQWVEMPPLQSLLKNALLLLLVLLHYKFLPSTRQPRRPWLPLVLSLALASVPFWVSVPDNWMFGPQQQSYDAELLHASLTPGGPLSDHDLGNDRRLLVFVTQGCPYCKMAREKLSTIASRHRIDPSRIVYILPSQLPDNLFVRITYGARPLLILLDGKEVVGTYHYRNINEREIADFLTP